ncbi:MAG: AMP-binding protein [Conexivisphaerales archaeon]
MSSASEGLKVISFLRRAANLFPDKLVVHDDMSISYNQLYSIVMKLSSSLEQIGVKKGDVVGVADWNSIRFLAFLYSSALSGFIIYPVNIRLPPEHIVYTLRNSECKWLFVSEDFAPLASKSGLPPERVLLMRGKDDFGVKLGSDVHMEDYISGHDPYSILYTSGTTGMPKGVLYTNDRVVLGGMSIVYQLGLFNTSAKLTSEDVIMPLIPFYHLWAWGSPFHAAYLGAKYVLGGRFSAETTIDLILKHKVTWLNAIPTMIYQLLSSPRGEELKGLDRGLKVLVGGSPVPKGLADMMERFGIRYSTIYGGTDMLATAVQLKKDKQSNSIHPVPFVDVKVVRPDGGEARRGEMGELLIRAPWLPEGYYKDEARTAASFSEGWFRTGDVARLDEDGGIEILDRVKDVVKSGGEWIPTSILESLISEVKGVASVAVIAKSDQKWGERPVAIIKPREKGEGLEQAVTTRLKEAASNGKIASFWIPEELIFVDDIPLTSVGKIDKKVLKERYG